MIDFIDRKRATDKLIACFDNIGKNKTDVMGFFQALGPQVAMELAMAAFDPKTSEKVRIEAMKDLLDRAGYGKVTKHALATVDATTSKDALFALIEGTRGDISDDLEIIEDVPEDEPEDDEY